MSDKIKFEPGTSGAYAVDHDRDTMDFTAPIDGCWYINNAYVQLKEGEKLRISKKLIENLSITFAG